VGRLASGYGKRLGKLFEYDVKAELARFNEFKETLTKYVVDGVTFRRTAQERRCENGHRGRKSNVLVPRSNE
jgi:adenylosuccinate synthase